MIFADKRKFLFEIDNSKKIIFIKIHSGKMNEYIFQLLIGDFYFIAQIASGLFRILGTNGIFYSLCTVIYIHICIVYTGFKRESDKFCYTYKRLADKELFYLSFTKKIIMESIASG